MQDQMRRTYEAKLQEDARRQQHRIEDEARAQRIAEEVRRKMDEHCRSARAEIRTDTCDAGEYLYLARPAGRAAPERDCCWTFTQEDRDSVMLDPAGFERVHAALPEQSVSYTGEYQWYRIRANEAATVFSSQLAPTRSFVEGDSGHKVINLGGSLSRHVPRSDDPDQRMAVPVRQTHLLDIGKFGEWEKVEGPGGTFKVND